MGRGRLLEEPDRLLYRAPKTVGTEDEAGEVSFHHLENDTTHSTSHVAQAGERDLPTRAKAGSLLPCGPQLLRMHPSTLAKDRCNCVPLRVCEGIHVCAFVHVCATVCTSMCLCVCMCTCTFVCMCVQLYHLCAYALCIVHVCAYVYVQLCVYLYSCVFACICACMCNCVYICVPLCVCIIHRYICAHECASVYMCASVSASVHVCAHVSVHVYTCMCVHLCVHTWVGDSSPHMSS